MQICREIGGYSYGRADLVRRAMAKKKHDVMEKERSAFIYGTESNCGAVANGVPADIANQIFDEMSGFASYAFNKSHAAAYATVAYQTAYLRKHYYLQYMTSLISSVIDWTDKMVEYIKDLTDHGVKLLPPDINRSMAGFSVEGNAVRYGLLAIKNLGRNTISSIISERHNGEYTSLEDFCIRMAPHDNNRRSMEALIKSGAMSAFPQNRHQMLMSVDKLLDKAHDEYNRNVSGQLDLFGGESDSTADFIYPATEEYTHSQILALEKEMIGLYVSGHPADEFIQNSPEDCMFISDALGMPEGRTISVIAVIAGRKVHVTKKGDSMAFVQAEDSTAAIECLVFPEVFRSCMRELTNGEVLLIRGKISRRDEQPKLIAEQVNRADSLPAGKRKTLYINLDRNDTTRITAVTDLLRRYPGMSEVRLCFRNDRSVVKPNGINGVRICTETTAKLNKICGNSNIIIK